MSWLDSLVSESNRPWLRALVVAAGGLLLAGLFSYTTVYPRLAWWLDDAFQRRLAVALPMDQVVVIDVDEASMQRLQPSLGAWPYARDVYAKAHRFLAASGARAVAYDILFSESRAGDDAFGAALDRRGVLPAAALPYPHERPLAELTRATQARVGVFSTITDDDGVVRRLAPLHLAYGQVLPGFPVAALLAAEPAKALRFDGRVLRLGEHAWPMATDGSIS